MTILDELNRRLSPLGWTPAEPWDADEYVTYARRLDDEMSYELGLDVELREPGGWSLNPVLGVRHAEVARLTARFLEVPPGGACLTAAMLADLVPDSPARWSAGLADEAAVADQVVADLRTYGEPFLGGLATVADVIARVREDRRRTQMDDAHLAVAYALSGDAEAARLAIADFAAKATAQPLLAQDQAARFLANFQDHFQLT